MTEDQRQPRQVSRFELFTGFLMVGLFGFGGIGAAIYHVVVERRKWLSADDYATLLGLGQVLPGASLINITTILGDRNHGPMGALVALDVTHVSRGILVGAFDHEDPRYERAETFVQTRVPYLAYAQPDWAPPVYLAMRANLGVLECWDVPNEFRRGALAFTDRAYRGEAYVAEGEGVARAEEAGNHRAAVVIELARIAGAGERIGRARRSVIACRCGVIARRGIGTCCGIHAGVVVLLDVGVAALLGLRCGAGGHRDGQPQHPEPPTHHGSPLHREP